MSNHLINNKAIDSFTRLSEDVFRSSEGIISLEETILIPHTNQIEKSMQYFINSNNQAVNSHGDLIRTKESHPYNYDPIIQFQLPASSISSAPKNSVYTDRMLGWDYKNYRKCQAEVFNDENGDYYHNRTPEKIQEFLRVYYSNSKIILTKVTEYCNQATGYPTWLLEFTE